MCICLHLMSTRCPQIPTMKDCDLASVLANGVLRHLTGQMLRGIPPFPPPACDAPDAQEIKLTQDLMQLPGRTPQTADIY